MENNWYVYIHIRLDNNEPFYIGIGNKKNYARAYQTKPDRRNQIWCNIRQNSYEDCMNGFLTV